MTRKTAAPHATLLKFGYPATIVWEQDSWAVLLRPVQVTLGSLVLVCREDATAFPDASSAAFTELKPVTRRIEAALASAFAFDRINYLMLRMVDPHVHFHVLPRYETKRTFNGLEFEDAAWPRPPDLALGTALDERTGAALLELLREKLEEAAA